MLIGFSTGCLHKTHERVSVETFDIFRSLGCNAIEILIADNEDLEKLIAQIVPNDLASFSYVSLHAPAIYEVKTLELLQKAHDIFNFKAITIHPDEIENWEMLERFPLPLAIENMDWKKEVGKYAESMQDIFDKHDMQMVLDLNHCYTNDPSMRLAEEMCEKFDKRISEINLSGFEKFHEPLFKTKQQEIINSITDKSAPMIIESGCESIKDARKEFEYIKSVLEKNKSRK